MAIWQTHFNYIKYANKITWKIMCERERYGLWCAYTYALSGIILFYCILSFWIHHEICIHTPSCYSIFKKITSPEVGQSHWVHGEKGPAEAVLPSPAEEVQPATGAVDTVLLCHHWIHPLHVNSCLVQLSYQIWPQKTTEGSPDCWANHWYIPPHSPRTVLIQSEQRADKITLDPSHPAHSLFELLLSGQRYRALSTRTSRHRNRFFPQAIHLMNTWH